MSSVRYYVEAAPDGAARVLQALAVAESLTDDVAREIYELDPIEGLRAEFFVRALHYSDFVSPRNSEWNFTPEARREIQAMDMAKPDVLRSAHESLIRLAAEGDRSLASISIPGYLFTNAGAAYHKAALGNVEEAISLYSKASEGPLNGAQWLASKLVEEQEAEGVLPSNRVETDFLRAWVYYGERNRAKAEPLMRRVAQSDKVCREVAIATHLVGNWERSRNQREAETLLRRSLDIGERINLLPHVAHVAHSLANLIGFRNSDEAEKLLRESLKSLESLGDRYGAAQTQHSLANLIGRNRNRSDEAEKLYRESWEIGKEIGNRHHIAQTQHSLANLIGRDRNRRDEAEKLLQESLKIGEELKNLRHQAQVLRSLSFVVEHRSPSEAKQLLEQSLELNQRARDRRGEDIVRRSLKQLRERYGL